MTENIINKIKNLLKQTVENGCTEAEAQTAFAMARKLMLKYKIEESAVIDKSQKEIIRICLSDYNIKIKWLYLLIDVFTENFGVMKCIINNGNKQHFILVGLKTDVECVKELIDCAYAFANDKVVGYISAYRQIHKTAKGIKESWLNGFVNGLYAKYEEQNKTNEEFALILSADVDVKRKFEEFTQGAETKESTIEQTTCDINATLNGYKEGKKFGTTPLPE